MYKNVLVGVAAQYGLKPVLDYGDPQLAALFDRVGGWVGGSGWQWVPVCACVCLCVPVWASAGLWRSPQSPCRQGLLADKR